MKYFASIIFLLQTFFHTSTNIFTNMRLFSREIFVGLYPIPFAFNQFYAMSESCLMDWFKWPLLFYKIEVRKGWWWWFQSGSLHWDSRTKIKDLQLAKGIKMEFISCLKRRQVKIRSNKPLDTLKLGQELKFIYLLNKGSKAWGNEK